MWEADPNLERNMTIHKGIKKKNPASFVMLSHKMKKLSAAQTTLGDIFTKKTL